MRRRVSDDLRTGQNEYEEEYDPALGQTYSLGSSPDRRTVEILQVDGRPFRHD